MKKALAAILKYVIFLGLGIWITYHMLHQLDAKQRDDLLSAIASLNPWFLIPIGIAGYFSHYIRAVRWRLLLETIDLRPTKANTMFAVMIGYLTNLAFPRAGEVAKCTVLAKYEDMPAHKMVGTIVAERAFDILCLFTLTVAAFFLEVTRISAFVAEKTGALSEKIHRHRNTILLVTAILVIVIAIVVLLYRRNRESKGGVLLKEMTHGILSIIHMKKKWQFLGYTALMWLMYWLQIYIGLRSLPGTTNLSPVASLVVLVYGSVGLIVTPGGIGAYPYLVAQILGAYPVNEVTAQAFGWIAWALQTCVIILLGVFSLLYIHTYNKKRNGKIAMDTK
ncbi:MAG: flippase-like domain-containing protein [Taibaiella sp.]|nr:flippase-like domain-containing protein [Taibaiella sp.]